MDGEWAYIAFPPELVDRYFADYARELGLDRQQFLALGRQRPDDDEPFNMTILALRLAARSNGVSRLHGQVSRRMWVGLWPGVPEADIPIGHVTNGIHVRSWLSAEMEDLFDRYLGPRWREEPADAAVWRQIAHGSRADHWRGTARRAAKVWTPLVGTATRCERGRSTRI